MTPKKIIPLLAIMISINNLPVSADIINIPGDYPTIQEGIDAASEGDTVLVKPGIYMENIHLYWPNITLASLFLTTGEASYISSTIIDGDSTGPVIASANLDSTANIIGFTIQNGYSHDGAGIYCLMSSPTIAYNIIKNNATYSNSGYVYGGGIFCNRSSPKIINNVIKENSSCFGGGIGCYEGAHPIIDNNIILRNIADP